MYRRLIFAVVLVFALARVALPTRVGRGNAEAPESVAVVHEETMHAGPYRVVVGFSDWSMLSDRSLDIVLMPDGGIAHKQGTATLTSPTGDEDERPLVRHPRMRSAWGLNIIALPREGQWIMQVALDGPVGAGTGSVLIMLGPRPGPSLTVDGCQSM